MTGSPMQLAGAPASVATSIGNGVVVADNCFGNSLFGNTTSTAGTSRTFFTVGVNASDLFA
jgi:hypothetical protein